MYVGNMFMYFMFKMYFSQSKMAHIYSYKIYTKFSQITRQFGRRFECRLISNIEKKKKKDNTKPQNNTTFIFSRACIKYVMIIEQIDSWPIFTNKSSVNIKRLYK